MAGSGAPHGATMCRARVAGATPKVPWGRVLVLSVFLASHGFRCVVAPTVVVEACITAAAAATAAAVLYIVSSAAAGANCSCPLRYRFAVLAPAATTRVSMLRAICDRPTCSINEILSTLPTSPNIKRVTRAIPASSLPS